MSKTITTSFITEFDMHLFSQGVHLRLYEKLGAHVIEVDGVAGTNFAVWAPSAAHVCLTGDFNDWHIDATPMERLGASGIWNVFVPGLAAGENYKFHVTPSNGAPKTDHSDPYGFFAEMRPKTASIVCDLSTHKWADSEWMESRSKRNSIDAPISIYEVQLGSWMRGENNRWLTYVELAENLTAYVKRMGYTHVEFMPIAEYPYDGSWGYQTTGYFAPTSRFGAPDEFMMLVDTLHQHNIGVIVDWVPGHFPRDGHALGLFDGTHLYEHADPKQGEHKEWGTYVFNYGRYEVEDFLICNAIFWFDKYHIDGLRVDAVASMLYLDYSRADGEWLPNKFGGRENLEAVEFLKLLNEQVYSNYPDVMVIAEESTSWPRVSRPTYLGGLGFGYKWDMGWMHDTLDYMSQETINRKYHQNKLTFRGMYAFSENFVLPVSHDEVVYGKGSLLNKMPGDDWQKFANLRLFLGHMFATPAKKLLFMGCDFGQWREWNYEQGLDWHLLDSPFHAGIARLVVDLNQLYRTELALHELDCDPAGFDWVDCSDFEQSVLSFVRNSKNKEEQLLVVCNFTPVVRHHYKVGVSQNGFYREILNSDSGLYNGSNVGNNGGVQAEDEYANGQIYSLSLTLPPLAVLIFKRD